MGKQSVEDNQRQEARGMLSNYNIQALQIKVVCCSSHDLSYKLASNNIADAEIHTSTVGYDHATLQYRLSTVPPPPLPLPYSPLTSGSALSGVWLFELFAPSPGPSDGGCDSGPP